MMMKKSTDIQETIWRLKKMRGILISKFTGIHRTTNRPQEVTRIMTKSMEVPKTVWRWG